MTALAPLRWRAARTYGRGADGHGRAAADRRARSSAGAPDRARRSVGLGQVDAAAPAGRAGHADRRDGQLAGDRRRDLRPGPVGIVFQGPSLLAPLTVVENVALPLLLAGEPRQPSARAPAALERLGLLELADKLPGGDLRRPGPARRDGPRARAASRG